MPAFVVLLCVFVALPAVAQTVPPEPPDAERLFAAGEYGWESYKDGPPAGLSVVYFPYRYDGPRWRVPFRSFLMSSHVRMPRPDGDGWFYWPFRNRPPKGCDWYAVPTRRKSEETAGGVLRYRYWRWNRLNLCFP